MNIKYLGDVYVGLIVLSLLVYLGVIANKYLVKECQNKYGLTYNEKEENLALH